MDYLEWKTAFTETLRQLVHRASEFVPNLLSALVLMALGWLVARLARASVEKLLGAGLRRLAKAPLITLPSTTNILIRIILIN